MLLLMHIFRQMTTLPSLQTCPYASSYVIYTRFEKKHKDHQYYENEIDDTTNQLLTTFFVWYVFCVYKTTMGPLQ